MDRIDEYLKELGEIWKKNPELRLGQLIDNVLLQEEDLYYISDVKLLERLKEWY